MAPNPDQPHSAQAEHRHHAYVTNSIPWWVRLVWIGFWVFTVYYTVVYLFPALQREIELHPPVKAPAK